MFFSHNGPPNSGQRMLRHWYDAAKVGEFQKMFGKRGAAALLAVIDVHPFGGFRAGVVNDRKFVYCECWRNGEEAGGFQDSSGLQRPGRYADSDRNGSR